MENLAMPIREGFCCVVPIRAMTAFFFIGKVERRGQENEDPSLLFLNNP